MSSSPGTVPGPVLNAARAMDGFGRPWALCGGWAVDAWLGKVTRDHLDIDITCFVEDAPALFAHLREWNLVAHDDVEPQATDPWDGRSLVLPAHLHARPPGAKNREIVHAWVTPPYKNGGDGLDFDFELNGRDGDACVFQRHPLIAHPIDDAFQRSPWGVPALSPEAIAFFKATAYFGQGKLWARPHDVADFEALVALLDAGHRGWLKDAIATLHPEHPWLPDLVPTRPPAKE